jgi:trigger factor
VETVPDFELKEFKGKITKITPLIEKKIIEAAKKSLMDSDPILVKADRDYVIKPGDGVSYRAQYIVNGTPSKKKSFENSMLIPQNLPEDIPFLNGFIGKKIGESFDFSPEGSHDVTCRLTIKSIKKSLLHLSFEEYAEIKGFKSAEELEKIIVEALEADIKKSAFIYHKQQILNILVKEYNFDLPKSIVEQETRNVIARIRQEIDKERAHGEATEEDLKKTDEDFAIEYGDLIRKRVLLGYILNKFAKKYGITVDNNEVKNAIIAEANSNPSRANDIIKYYATYPTAAEYLRAEIVEMRVIMHLIDMSECEEVEKTKKEVEKLVDKILEK